VVPFLTNAKVSAAITWKGGTVQIQDKSVNKELKLRGQAFTVLATLIVVAKYGRDPTGNNSSALNGFLTDGEIVKLASELGRVTLATGQIKKHILTIRKALTRMWHDPKKGDEWANRLIELNGSLGYRLSTAPANIYLEILPAVASAQKFRDLIDGRSDETAGTDPA
jgi:hypothetical protein